VAPSSASAVSALHLVNTSPKSPSSRRILTATALVLLMASAAGCGPKPPEAPTAGIPELEPGLGYTNHHLPQGPWSVHVVRIPRTGATVAFHAVHAGGSAFGLAPISAQVRGIPAGTALAAVNGDFYQRERTFAGDPRGLQLMDGELLSAPKGVCLWTGGDGTPHVDEVNARFTVTWPDGTVSPLGLHEEPEPDRLVLFTAAAGPSTRTSGGREWKLVPQEDGLLRPVAPGARRRARVESVRDGGDSPIPTHGLVLSAGRGLARRLPTVDAGAVLTLDLATSVPLDGAVTGIGGGPVLVRGGKAVRIEVPDDDAYQFKSMRERHPRSAVGWNAEHYFLVTSDGRREGAAGMTLEELGAYLASLGCTDAMNLDGGGSATLWAGGAIRNQPSDGSERPIANALAIVRQAGRSP
jgi:hypothetical protein